MNLNKVFVLGRVTRDPEMKSLPSGIKVVSLGIATNKVYYTEQKEKKEMVEFHNVVFFGKSAEIVNQYVNKGGLLLVEGRLQTRTWDDKDSGKKQYRTEIIADSFQLPPRGMSGESSGAPRSSGKTPEEEQADRDFEKFGQGEGEAPAKKKGARSKNSESIEYPDDELNPDDIPF